MFKLDTSDVGKNTESNIDFDKMNQEVIGIVGTENKSKTVVGFVSGIYDLGLQNRPPFEKLFDPGSDEEQKDVAEGRAFVEHREYFFDDGRKYEDVEVFSKPRKPAKGISLAVDFPQYIVDKGKYFGEANPQPLRIILGGEWMAIDPEDENRKMKIIQSPFYLVENTDNRAKEYALGSRTTLYKMGAAANLLNSNENLKASEISGLLGKPFLFELRIYNKPSNSSSESYYTEKIKFLSEVPDGLPIPDFDKSLIHGVNLNVENDLGSLKQLRNSVKNTIKLAKNWEGSILKEELEALAAEEKPAEVEENDIAPASEDKPPEDYQPFDDESVNF